MSDRSSSSKCASSFKSLNDAAIIQLVVLQQLSSLLVVMWGSCSEADSEHDFCCILLIFNSIYTILKPLKYVLSVSDPLFFSEATEYRCWHDYVAREAKGLLRVGVLSEVVADA